MFSTRFRVAAVPILLAGLLWGGAVGLRVAGAAPTRPLIPDQPRPGLPTEYLRIVSLGFDELVADVLWLRFLQNIPLERPSDSTRDWLANQVESVVALDPSFDPAYVHGGTILGVRNDNALCLH